VPTPSSFFHMAPFIWLPQFWPVRRVSHAEKLCPGLSLRLLWFAT
jgi:hypothetical protein